MKLSAKKSKKARVSSLDSEDLSDLESEKLTMNEEDDDDSHYHDDGKEDDEDEDNGDISDDNDDGEDNEEEEEGEDSRSNEEEENEDDDYEHNNKHNHAEMEELEKEYMDLRNQEQDILKNLKQHKDDDLLKGQAVKNQKALWDKTLEFRFLLQKAFSNSNRLPQDPVRSSFCSVDEQVSVAYSDLITSSKKTLNSLLQLQEALLENNPSIDQSSNGRSSKKNLETTKLNDESDEEWSWISHMHRRIAAFRDKSVDKWQRKTQVTTGAAAIKGKLHAFNQNVSAQVAAYMRDPSRMIKQMQQRRSTVDIFGTVIPEGGANTSVEVLPQEAQPDGDPELLDDTEFYQQLLKEFFETIDPTSSDTAFYALNKLRTKKRKIVDRRASKSRKIRYNVHEKIVNFMAPHPMDLPPMAPKLFENLFGLKTQKAAASEL